jgi:hypothetical protein
LVGNLSYTGNSNAITINAPLPGPVVVDLEGYTITGSGAGPGGRVTVGIIISSSSPNTYPITVRNGIIQNFAFGVYATSGPNLISHLTLYPIYEGVYFGFVNSSTISDCTIYNATYGIEEYASGGGNRYSNISFSNVPNPLWVHDLLNTSQILEHCHFEAPAN